MPSCLVNKCASHTGKKGQSPAIMLHKFRKDPERIRSWLLQTGQTFENLDKLVKLIFEAQEDNKYWICSLHFTSESYLETPTGRVLRPDAVPSIFEGFREGENVIEETLKKKQTRAKRRVMTTVSSVDSDATTSSQSNETFLQDTQTTGIEIKKEADCFFLQDTETTGMEIKKEAYCSIGTQTEYTLCNSKVEYLEPPDEKYDIKIKIIH